MQVRWAEADPQVEKDTEKFPLSKCFMPLTVHFTVTPRSQLQDRSTPHSPVAHPSQQSMRGLVTIVLSTLPRRAVGKGQAVSQQGRSRTPCPWLPPFFCTTVACIGSSPVSLHPGPATWSKKVPRGELVPTSMAIKPPVYGGWTQSYFPSQPPCTF